MTNVTRSNKRGTKSLGPIRATSKEVRDNHHVLHLTPTLQLAMTFLHSGIWAWLKYQLTLHVLTFLLSQCLKSDKIDLRPLSWERVTNNKWLPTNSNTLRHFNISGVADGNDLSLAVQYKTPVLQTKGMVAHTRVTYLQLSHHHQNIQVHTTTPGTFCYIGCPSKRFQFQNKHIHSLSNIFTVLICPKKNAHLKKQPNCACNF